MSEDKARAITRALPQKTSLEVKAEAFARSGMFPNVKTFAQAITKIEIGRDYGLAPTVALRGLHLIPTRGGVKVEFDGTLLRAMIRKYPGYDYRIDELTEKKATISLLADDGGVIASESFTIEDAKKADLAGKDNYQHYPRNMLLNRATANLVRFYCPEVTMAPAYTHGEISGEDAYVDYEEIDPEEVAALLEPVVRPKEIDVLMSKARVYLNDVVLNRLRELYGDRNVSDESLAAAVFEACEVIADKDKFALELEAVGNIADFSYSQEDDNENG